MRNSFPMLALAALLLSVAPSAPVGPPRGGSPAPSGLQAELTPVQQDILAFRRAAGGPIPALCWSEGTDERVLQAFRAAPLGPTSIAYDFSDANRWSSTATDGSGLTQGSPTTLTWGILPDGVTIPGSGEPSSDSRLIQVLDNQIDPGPGGSDLTQRPWFPLIEQALEAWGEVAGVRYVYEPNDDGAAFPSSPGVLGVRPDVRIGGHPVDGSLGRNIFGYNFFPNLGDMVLDTDNGNVLGSAPGNYIYLRNLIGHEHGHGLGINHACPEELTKLMEPTIATNFDGPQHDDMLAVNRGYGDRFEHPVRNDVVGAATDLGSFAPGDTLRESNLSIDDRDDSDYLAFTVPDRMRVSVTVTPVGFLYLTSFEYPEGGCPVEYNFLNSRIQNNPGFEIRGPSGTDVLRTADFRPAGQPEEVDTFLLTEGPGTYFIRVFGDTTRVQLYDLELAVSGGQAPVAVCKTVTACTGTIPISRFDGGAYDPDDDPITISVAPEPPYPPGVTPVAFIVSDGVYADTCQTTITVNRPPVAVARNLMVQADSTDCLADVDPGLVDDGSSDPEGDAITRVLDPAGPFAVGVHPVELIVTDRCGIADTAAVEITVTCSVPVELLSLAVERVGDQAVLTWEVASEEDHAGFFVHSRLPGEPRVQLTPDLLFGRRTYRFVDPEPPALRTEYWLEELSRGGVSSWHGPVTLEAFRIEAFRATLRPNPFAGSTTLHLALPEAGPVAVAVYDIRGRRVRILEEGFRGAGEHTLLWDGRDGAGQRASAGLYFVRVRAGGRESVQKVVLTP